MQKSTDLYCPSLLWIISHTIHIFKAVNGLVWFGLMVWLWYKKNLRSPKVCNQHLSLLFYYEKGEFF